MQFITKSIIKSVVRIGTWFFLARSPSQGVQVVNWQVSFMSGRLVYTPLDLCNEDLHWTRDHLQ